MSNQDDTIVIQSRFLEHRVVKDASSYSVQISTVFWSIPPQIDKALEIVSRVQAFATHSYYDFCLRFDVNSGSYSVSVFDVFWSLQGRLEYTTTGPEDT